ncbi:MAG: serine/threonine-protein kinase [Myxococcota bacterium]
MAYKLLSVEGTGAYGTVVKARDRRNSRRIVALKVLRDDHLDNPRVLARTRDEARMLEALSHPNIVRVFGLDESWGRPVIVMEWLEAYSLGDLIDKLGVGLPVDISCQLIAWAASALDHAWNRDQGDPPRPMRLVHRDLKPNNMLITIHGELKLVDFGLAHGDFDGKESHTVSMVLGTRAYMAPERLDGADDHPSADVYATGLMLFELLQGRPMSLSLNYKHHATRLSEKLLALHLGDLDPRAGQRLKLLLSNMLAYEPEDRPIHSAVESELQAIMAIGNLSPDVHAFARRAVKPLVTLKRPSVPEEHQDWPHISFLEEPAQVVTLRPKTLQDPDTASANDALIRTLLTADRWMNQLPRLRLLLQDGLWTPAPFIEVLDSALEHQWSGSGPDPRKVAMALNLMRNRPTAEAVQRAAALVTFEDDLVATTARQFIEAAKRAEP